MMEHWASNDQWGDLLGRPILQGDAAKFASVCTGKTVLVTGAGGSIGSLLARAIVKAGARLALLLDKSADDLQRLCNGLAELPVGCRCLSIPGDICDPELLDRLFHSHRPEIIFHAAALKYVPLLERDPLAAIRTNTLGTYSVAQAAMRYEADRMVFISTDKAVSPANIMGASKRLGELMVLASNTATTRMNCVRFGNVLGSQGGVVPLFEDQIRRKETVTVTHPEVTRYFLTGNEAVLLVMAAASLDAGGQILVPRLGEPIKIMDLARFLIRKAGAVPGRDVDIVLTQLRPGDKMAEKLVAPVEIREPAIVGLLDRVVPPRVSLEVMQEWISGLRKCLKSNDAEATVATVRRILPDYQPGPELLEFVRSSKAQTFSR